MQSPSLSGIGGFNPFAKPVEGIQSKSTSGGIITILCYITATILFVSQLYLYIQVDIRHSLNLAPSFPLSEVIPTDGGFSKIILASRGAKSKKKKDSKSKAVYEALKFIEKNKIDVFIHITFPYLRCEDVDFAHNGAAFSSGDFSKNHGYAKFTKRHPTEYDLAVATGVKNLKGFSKRKISTDQRARNACTVRGTISVPRISGDITIFMSQDTFRNLIAKIRTGTNADHEMKNIGSLDHYIHSIEFGKIFPLTPNPLSDKMVTFPKDHSVSLDHVNVKLVPTIYKRFARRKMETFQLSVSNHIVTMETLATNGLAFPGLKIQYDFTPLAVHHVESRENFFVFLSSLIGIVGGVFVSVGLVSGAVVKSAKALKKID